MIEFCWNLESAMMRQIFLIRPGNNAPESMEDFNVAEAEKIKKVKIKIQSHDHIL